MSSICLLISRLILSLRSSYPFAFSLHPAEAIPAYINNLLFIGPKIQEKWEVDFAVWVLRIFTWDAYINEYWIIFIKGFIRRQLKRE